MAPALYPLRFQPIFKTALWGGRRLAQLLPDAPAEGPIAEAWLVSDVDDNLSMVADGALTGTSLRDLMQTRHAELLGRNLGKHDNFPLLVKIIDAAMPLSVQVHPNDEQAQQLAGQPRGKTEAWYVLHAEPGAKIYAGSQAGVDRAAFESSLQSGEVERCLYSFEPHVGDCVFIPAGTIHAAGAGLTILEIQQTSDITYRVHDWGRVDAKTGQPRQLHIDQALACLDFSRGPVKPVKTVPGEPAVTLVDCQYFQLRRIASREELLLEFSECRIVAGIGGRASLEMQATHDSAILNPGSVLLVPPGRVVLRPQPEFTWLLCRPM